MKLKTGVALAILITTLSVTLGHGQVVDSSWVKIIQLTAPAIVIIETEKNLGSGFFVRADGTFVTNYHVIADAKEITVKFNTGETYRRAYVLSSDEQRDIAILRIEATEVPILPLANSNESQVGEEVLLIGAPRGLEQTVSNGIISGIRMLEGGTKMIQTTAPASPGSSGGPLLNRGGYVVGILTSSVVNGQNLNFAIPINYAKGILETLSVSTPRPARLLVGPKINPDPPITENPKEVISAAKTIIVRQIAGNPEFLLSVEKELRSWKRFSLVNDSQYADLILDISPTSEIDVMAGKGARAIGILTTRRSSRLWSTVKGGDFSLTGLSTSSVGKAIVQELRKFVERERRPR